MGGFWALHATDSLMLPANISELPKMGNDSPISRGRLRLVTHGKLFVNSVQPGKGQQNVSRRLGRAQIHERGPGTGAERGRLGLIVRAIEYVCSRSPFSSVCTTATEGDLGSQIPHLNGYKNILAHGVAQIQGLPRHAKSMA
jgi:hypothetical protein